MEDEAAELPGEFAEALARVRPRLGTFARRVLYFHSVGSTNDIASEIALAGEAEGTVVVADAQTCGRGRRGRSWFSPIGAGLYVSIVVCPSRARVDPERAVSLLTLSAGVALAEAVMAATGLPPAIKWPNDLLVGRRKLAGILAESITVPYSRLRPVVLGYGINVLPAAFPPELSDQATSLEMELGRSVDRGSLWAETLVAMAARYSDLVAGRFDAILDAWSARAPGSRGARIVWDGPDGPVTGTTEGVDSRGALLIRVGSRTERVVSGEVSWT